MIDRFIIQTNWRHNLPGKLTAILYVLIQKQARGNDDNYHSSDWQLSAIHRCKNKKGSHVRTKETSSTLDDASNARFANVFCIITVVYHCRGYWVCQHLN